MHLAHSIVRKYRQRILQTELVWSRSLLFIRAVFLADAAAVVPEPQEAMRSLTGTR